MFTNALTLVVLAGVALAQTFSINTPPSIQQCQPAALSWVGGTGPYIIAAIPAGQVSAAALTTISSSATGNSATWNVNLAQGTAISLKITDSTGAIAYSNSVTVQAGSSSSCLTGSSASSAASGASSGVSASASSASAAVSSAASSVGSAASSASSGVAASISSVSSVINSATSSSSTSRAASSTAAASSSGSAGFAKASLNIPVLALAAAVGCVAFGGFAVLA